MSPVSPRGDPLRGRLARRACDLVEHFARDHPNHLPELERLATAVPLWLRRHGLTLTLKKIEALPADSKARNQILTVLNKLDLTMTVDLVKIGPSQAALIACSAVALRHADVFCEVVKAMLYSPVAGGATASSAPEDHQP